jgi:serine/threonine protein kinase
LGAESNPIAVKRAKNPEWSALIRREADILTALKHPLVLELRARIPGASAAPSIVMEFAGNGSLAGFFTADDQRRIPLAMPFVHSRGGIHRDLNRDNILLDRDWNWNWSVRIADFGRSASPDAVPRKHSDAPDG